MAAPPPSSRAFQPLPKQREFLEATDAELMYSGAFGAGKSRVLCEKAHFLSVYYPGNVGLLCRKVAADLPSTTLKSLLDEVIPESHIVRQNKSEHWIDIRTRDPQRPSRIYWRGLDRPAGIGSMNLGWAGCDEAIEFDEDDWTMLTGRLRLNAVPFRQIFAATNPGAPSHWLYKRAYIDRLMRVVETDAFSNPHNPPDYVARLKRLTGRHKLRFVDGKWVGFEGLVYPDFSPLTHVVDRFEIPADWPRYRAIDFGTANAFVCQWWAKNPTTDQLVRYREIYMTGRRASEHAKQVHELSEGERYQFTVSDHNLDSRLEFEAAGISTIAAVKDVKYGIESVANRLRINSVTGQPGIVFVRDALVEEDPSLSGEGKPTCTEAEIGSYKYAKGAHDTTKEEPLKKNDHGLDAMRYLVVGVDRFELGGLASPDLAEFY